MGETADEDKVGSKTGPDALGLFLAAASGSKSSTSPREYQYGPAGEKSLEALHLETPPDYGIMSTSMLPKEDDMFSTVNGFWNATSDKQSQSSQTGNGLCTSGEKGEAEKEHSATAPWDEETPVAASLKEALPPAVNIWQQRKEAQARSKPNRSDPFVQQADVSVDEKSQGPMTGEKRRNFQNLLRDSQRPLAPNVENLGFEFISPKLQPIKSQPSSRYKPDSRPQFTALASAEQGAAQVSAQMIELGYETTENRITIPQELVKETRDRRMLTPSQRKQTAATRKSRACSDCRRRKERVSVLAGSRFSTETNTCLVYTWPARRLNES